MREAGQIAAATLLAVGKMIRPGISTEDINTFVHEDTLRRGARPAPLNYHGFPEERVHLDQRGGVPRHPEQRRVLGPRRHHQRRRHVPSTTAYHGDTSATFYVGEPSPEAQTRHRGGAALPRARHRGGARGRTARRHRRRHPGVRRPLRAARRAGFRRARHRPHLPRGAAGVVTTVVEAAGLRLQARACASPSSPWSTSADSKWSPRRQLDGGHARRLAVGAVRAHHGGHQEGLRGLHHAKRCAREQRALRRPVVLTFRPRANA